MKENTITIELSDANKLFATEDPDCAFLFLHVKAVGSFSLPRAVSDLGIGEERIKKAAGKLKKLGLLEEDKPTVVGMPEYTAEDIARRKDSDSDFAGLLRHTEKTFGRTVTFSDMKLLLGMLDHYALPHEICAMLITFVTDNYRKANGEGKIPPIRSVEKEARSWGERGIISIEAAEEYIASQKRKAEKLHEIASLLQIKGRALSKTEGEYIAKWIDFGFPAEAIAVAYDRTVVRTGRLTWKYMDSIICNWHSANLHTPEEINAGDRRYGSSAGNASAQEENEADKYKKLLELL
ncbi:MAG: DnaD domain protein [Oscillospiraceae bacterium]|nr:DnaD domain protein [Oscillospiraceae bacterium]